MGRQSSPALLLVAGWLRSVAAHGAVTHPKPRQAIDGSLAPWNGSVPDPVPFDTPNWCAHESAISTDWRNLSGSNGQACFWFSNGCDIGCDRCDGDTGQKIPCCDTKFLYTGNTYIGKYHRDRSNPRSVWQLQSHGDVGSLRLATEPAAARRHSFGDAEGEPAIPARESMAASTAPAASATASSTDDATARHLWHVAIATRPGDDGEDELYAAEATTKGTVLLTIAKTDATMLPIHRGDTVQVDPRATEWRLFAACAERERARLLAAGVAAHVERAVDSARRYAPAVVGACATHPAYGAPAGDGDQSELDRDRYAALEEVWNAGGDFFAAPSPLSPFVQACAMGFAEEVRRVLGTLDADDAAALADARCSCLRKAPVHAVVAGLRQTRADCDFEGTAAALADAGARIDARDLLGRTPSSASWRRPTTRARTRRPRRWRCWTFF
ncbi:hypothetical protein JL722_3490 [Aureococcus anophagefferens]|nr:hypothetical protein JL722_3490 [Aureococcus anophagefferens]